MAKIHGRHTRIYISGYDISSDSNSLEFGQPGDTVDVTGFGMSRRQYVVGILDQTIAHSGFFNDSAAGAHTVLKNLIGSSVWLALTYGTNIGDQAFAGSAVMENQYDVKSDISQAVTVTSNFVNNSQTDPIRPARVLQGRQSITASGSAAGSINYGAAASAVGGRGYLQVFSFAVPTGLGSLTCYVLDSADGAAWLPIGTFTQIGTASVPYGTSIPTTGAVVRQYTRGSWALTSGTADIWLGIATL